MWIGLKVFNVSALDFGLIRAFDFGTFVSFLCLCFIKYFLFASCIVHCVYLETGFRTIYLTNGGISAISCTYVSCQLIHTVWSSGCHFGPSNPRSLEEVNLPAGLRKLTISDQSLEGLELPSALETLSVSVQSEENNMTEPWFVRREDFLSFSKDVMLFTRWSIMLMFFGACLYNGIFNYVPVASHSPYMLGWR